MAFKKYSSAYVLYQPLSLSLYMDVVAGSLTQRRVTIGNVYDPDRSITPLVLRPRLDLVDPDNIITSGDHSSELVDCKWYIGTDTSGTLILPGDTDYVLGAYGELTVKKNVPSTAPVNLFFSCGFIDPKTQNTFRKTFNVTLSTVASEEANLKVDIDVPIKMVICPFKQVTERAINAQLLNGDTPVQDSDATYLWEVYNYTTKAWETITADHHFYAGGQNTRTLTIDRKFIDKELIRVKAYANIMPTMVQYATFKAFRWYGTFDFRCVVERGRWIRPTNTEISSLGIFEWPKGEIANPEKYFDITHIYTTNEKNAPQKVIGYGERVIVPSTIASKDPNVIPMFGVDVSRLSALRPITIGGSTLTMNGHPLCTQIPID